MLYQPTINDSETQLIICLVERLSIYIIGEGMFKVQKKKKILLNRSQRNGSDNSEDEKSSPTLTTRSLQNEKKGKAKKKELESVAVLSFSADDDYNGHDSSIHERKKTKLSGLGFGGVQKQMETFDNIESEHDSSKDVWNNPYSKENLEKLKSQQKSLNLPKENFVLKPESVRTEPTFPVPPVPSSDEFKPPEENFIPLEPQILAGDDALQYVSMDGQDSRSYPSSPVNMHSSQTDSLAKKIFLQEGLELAHEQDEKSWENQIAQRAGISVQKYFDSSSLPISKETHTQQLSSVTSTINATLENLKEQEDDLEIQINRQFSEKAKTEKETEEKEKELSTIGTNFEYYQKLRRDLADWIGALRHISSKIEMIEIAIRDLLIDVATKRSIRRRQWEDDCITILRENERLGYVIGRQSIAQTNKNENATIDEFGRDIRSLESLARSRRKAERSRRRKECSERLQDVTESDISDNEMMDREERRSALSDAVQVIFDEVDDEFTSISNLILLFSRWKSDHSDEFEQCYASLGLLDLVGVFVRAELCKSLDLIRLKRNDPVYPRTLQEFSWHRIIIDCPLFSSQKNQLSTLIQNYIGEALRFSLRGTKAPDAKNSCFVFDLQSVRQSRSFATMIESILLYYSDDFDWINQYMSEYMKSYIQEYSVPVILLDVKINDDVNEDLEEAIQYSTLGQLEIFGKMLSNILCFLYPIMPNKTQLANLCLMDIIAYRVLPILDVSITIYPDESKKYFHSVLQTTQNAGLIDNANFMIMSAPLRAAIIKYGQNQ